LEIVTAYDKLFSRIVAINFFSENKFCNKRITNLYDMITIADAKARPLLEASDICQFINKTMTFAAGPLNWFTSAYNRIANHSNISLTSSQRIICGFMKET